MTSVFFWSARHSRDGDCLERVVATLRLCCDATRHTGRRIAHLHKSDHNTTTDQQSTAPHSAPAPTGYIASSVAQPCSSHPPAWPLLCCVLPSAHYLDGAWDVGSLVLGVLALQRVVRDGQRGLSLRYVVWYAALSVINAGLYIAAWLYQRANGYPPVLPANPWIDWTKLTTHQRSTALLTYQLEQLPYIALAIAVMSARSPATHTTNQHANQHNWQHAPPPCTVQSTAHYRLLRPLVCVSVCVCVCRGCVSVCCTAS